MEESKKKRNYNFFIRFAQTIVHWRKSPLVEPAVTIQPNTASSNEYRHLVHAFAGNKRYKSEYNNFWQLDYVLNPEGYTRYYGEEEHYRFYYIRDHLGNVRETYVNPYPNNKQCVQRTQYYPSGLPWYQGTGQSEQPYKYSGKEFVEMHGLDEYDSEARWYYPAIMRTTTMDPLCEKYYSTSPYAWCGNNPVRLVDPDGRNPVYGQDGVLWGTDENGLQGAAIIMDSKLFQQNMSSKIASAFDVGTESLSDDAYQKYYDNYTNLPFHPDWDGYISLSEAMCMFLARNLRQKRQINCYNLRKHCDCRQKKHFYGEYYW